MFAWLLIIGTLLSGTISGITSKVLYSYEADGECGRHKFNKPYFLTMAMFIGEALCLLFYFGGRYLDSRKTAPLDSHFTSIQKHDGGVIGQPLMNALSESPASPSTPSDSEGSSNQQSAARPPRYYFLILSCFDLSATCLSLVGLKYIDLSTYSMLRGSMVVFTVIFSALILRAKYAPKQIASIVVVVLGLTVVGCVGFLRTRFPASNTPSSDGDSHTITDQAIGLTLVTLGSGLNAAQNVVEELLLKKYVVPVHPLEVVGWEGVFGLMTSSFILLPVLTRIPGDDCGQQEDTLDSLKMMGNDGGVIGLVLPYLLALAFMNWSSVAISQVLTAVHRQLATAVRTALIWMVDLFIYYVISTSIGEYWDNWSWLQLVGFGVLMSGTISFSVITSRLRQQQSKPDNQQPLMMLPDDDLEGHHHTPQPRNPALATTTRSQRERNYDADDLRALAEHDQLYYHDPQRPR